VLCCVRARWRAGGRVLKARLYLLSTVSALALSGATSAADLPVKAPPLAPVIISWAGPYIGLHGGIGWLHASQTITAGTPLATCTTTGGATCDLDATGAVFGGQVGYNWQQREWVFGIEADASWTSLKKTVSFSPFGTAFSHVIHDKISWLSSVRGRLGWAMGDTLFYATGGLAIANFDAGWFRIGGAARAQFDKTTTGWVAGGGIEKIFSRNWSARAEFLHYGLGKTLLTSTIGGTYTTAFRHDVSVVRLGVNFRP
jgi:outer membrane immunogenic protein